MQSFKKRATLVVESRFSYFHTRVLILVILASSCQPLAQGFQISWKAVQEALPTNPLLIVNNSPTPTNGLCDEFPHCFEGRFIFSPKLVRTDEKGPGNNSVTVLSLFGYTLGGTVVLEYDDSPVGPYNEYVTLSGLVTKRGAIGQWGSRLLVSTQPAAEICQQLWGVPAEVASIRILQDGGPLQSLHNLASSSSMMATSSQNPDIHVTGWERVLKQTESSTHRRFGNIPVLWTPTIKALWFPPWVPFSKSSDSLNNNLPLYRLRLSASAVRLRFTNSYDDEASVNSKEGLSLNDLSFALVVDNVLIEISPSIGML